MRRDLDESRFSGVRLGVFIVRDRMPAFGRDAPELSLPEEVLHILQVFCDRVPERCALLRSIHESDDTIFNAKQARALLKEIQIMGQVGH